PIRVSEEVIEELKKRNWQPENVRLYRRSTFHTWLQMIKREMKLDKNMELAPHSLRRAFATYNAVNGVPLPIIQRLLGHSKISTTAIYVKDAELANLAK
ncbi:16357_t:CDS:1, partial [Racocetra persica]